MQGARHGAELADQNYREVLRGMIQDRYPDAIVRDPAALMWIDTVHPRVEIRSAHAALANSPIVRRTALAAPVCELIDVFHRLTDLAGQSDVCVAWLPENEPSMGTAAEMLSAYRAGREVVAITPMRQNLAILACATLIVPTLQEFARWLDAGHAATPEVQPS